MENRISTKTVWAFMLIGSVVLSYFLTCIHSVGGYYLIQDEGPLGSSQNTFVAGFVSVVTVTASLGLMMALIPRPTIRIKQNKVALLFLAVISALLSIMMLWVSWFVYADSVYCRGCETGACINLVLFRSFKLWGAGAILAISVLLFKKTLTKI